MSWEHMPERDRARVVAALRSVVEFVTSSEDYYILSAAAKYLETVLDPKQAKDVDHARALARIKVLEARLAAVREALGPSGR